MDFVKGKKYDIIAVAHGLVDVLAYVDQKFLDNHKLVKGTMELITTERALYLNQYLRYVKRASGGSASNTMAGIASFGARAAIIARVKDDELGAIFKRDIGMCGLDFKGTTASSGSPTGRCFVAVSREDAERTMSTYLGAAADMDVSDLDEEAIKNSSILYIEGYLLDKQGSKEALMRAMEIANSNDKIVSMTLSDKRCIIQHRADLLNILSKVDVVFANENEIKTLFETTDLDVALKKISDICSIATITRGKKGSVVVTPKKRYDVAAYADPDKIVDTTGAGDLYASGFLYGIIKGMNLEKAARLGNMAASEAISHMGARPEITLHSLLNKL